jgi:hypothetical protein
MTKVIINDTNTGKVKVWHMGGRLRDRVGRYAVEKAEQGFSLAQRIEKWLYAVAKRWLFYPFVMASVLLVALYVTGGYALGKYAEAKAPKIQTTERVLVVKDETLPKILVKIAECESGNKHFNSDGTVIVGRKNNEDRGRFQVNRIVWGKKAKELGYNIDTEIGNQNMAVWIFENFGSEPWVYSKSCWGK